jgi:hypothetical protein
MIRASAGRGYLLRMSLALISALTIAALAAAALALAYALSHR